MSKQMVRSILAGTALVMTLTVTFPGSSQAAGFGPAMESGNVLELVLHWFADLWNGNQQQGGHTRTVLSKSTTSPSSGSGTTSGTPLVCGGDQGVCIDPNG
jgi:hypothetical protein